MGQGIDMARKATVRMITGTWRHNYETRGELGTRTFYFSCDFPRARFYSLITLVPRAGGCTFVENQTKTCVAVARTWLSFYGVGGKKK